MLRANHRPPSVLGDDPFSRAFGPSPYESDYEKHTRLEREIEAKRISDLIDDDIRRDKERFKRSKQDVRVSTVSTREPLPSNKLGSSALTARPGGVGQVHSSEAIPTPSFSCFTGLGAGFLEDCYLL